MPTTTIYAFGSNGSGQLGIGHVEDVSVPTRCLFGDDNNHADQKIGPVTATEGHDRLSSSQHSDRVLRITAGGNHTVILFESGAAYAAGLNDADSGRRCGVFSLAGKSEGTVLNKFERIVLRLRDGRVIDRFRDVSATWAATFLVCSSSSAVAASLEEDEIFVVGSGDKGELGLGPGKTCISGDDGASVIPNFPPQGLKIRAIASGMSHTVVALSNGDVYGWGASRKGQLGATTSTQKIVWSPVKIENIGFSATTLACGREFTFVGGRSPGSGEYYYTILGSENDKWGIISGIPTQSLQTAFMKGDCQVYTSWHGVYVHAADKSIVSWGRNDRGQLPPPPLLRQQDEKMNVSLIAAGSEHLIALLLVDDDDYHHHNKTIVVAFGWGEHGNCGTSVDSQGNVKDRYNEIPLSLDENETVVGVGAGCATSWIITSR